MILQNQCKNWMQKKKKRKCLLLGIHEDINLLFTTNPKQHQVLRLGGKKKKSWVVFTSYRHESKPKPQNLILLKKEGELWGFCFPLFWQQGRDRREWNFGERWGLGHGRREEDKGERKTTAWSLIFWFKYTLAALVGKQTQKWKEFLDPDQDSRNILIFAGP